MIQQELEPLRYAERLEVLLAAGVGLWDTVASATRSGSLDGAIKDHEANDLRALIEGLPQLRCHLVFLNGRKSAAIGRAAVGKQDRLAQVALPSSSPAFTLPFETKLSAWLELRAFLDSAG